MSEVDVGDTLIGSQERERETRNKNVMMTARQGQPERERDVDVAWRSIIDPRHSNHLNSMIVRIKNDDVAIVINRNSPRIHELTIS